VYNIYTGKKIKKEPIMTDKELIKTKTEELKKEFNNKEVKFCGFGWDYRDNTSFMTFLIGKSRSYSISL
jgi:hypothetical protein